jgi:hypothetical protein
MLKNIRGRDVKPGNIILFHAGDWPLKDNYFYFVVKIIDNGRSLVFNVLTRKGTFTEFFAKPNDKYGLLF